MANSKDDEMDSIQEKIPKKKKRRIEQEEKQDNFIDEVNLNAVNNSMSNVAIIESTSTDVSEQSTTRNKIANPYSVKKM